MPFFLNTKKSKDMKRKALMITGIFTGTAIGSVVAMALIDFSLEIFFMSFFALVGIVTLAVLTIAIISDARQEEKKENRSRMANWGFDKSYEE